MEFPKILLLSLFFALTIAQDDPYRLPTNVIPSRYEIQLTLADNFYETKTFRGTVRITVQLLEDTNTITLNSDSITYPDGSITIIDSENTVVALSIEHSEEIYKQITLTAPNILPMGTYTLVFENYEAVLHEDMAGFYLSSYTNENDQLEYVATTQFQPTDARRAFPSFDEPNFKAIFSLTITRPEGYVSLGPTNVTTVDNTDSFSDSPPMSTYLLAFIVSKFIGFRSRGAEERRLYDVWCREEAIETADYADEVGPKLLDALNEYTQINYYEMENVDKMDQVAIPDFSAGAMENWGLVTYRETALLWDENESTILNKQRVATVIAHEFTHMWFGNLVTLDWWAYTWLNEGFARYYQYFITALVETDWELEKQFVIEQQQVIFAADGLESSASLNSDASTPDEISSKFTSTSYNKGASVIRMMANFLGEENYVRGIQQYLQNHSYSNTQPQDLFDDLSVFTPDLPAELGTIMDTWTSQAGYPVVKVERTATGLVLSQERFLLNSAATSTSKWYIPITYTTAEQANFENTTVFEWLLPDQQLTITVESSDWVIVNLLETGYYRVNYDEELWQALGEALNSDNFDSTFPDLNRAQIVDDIMNLARANKLDYSIALNVTSFLANEVSYYPWYAAFNAFTFLRRRIDSSTYVGETLQKHILELMTTLYDSVSFTISSTTSHVNIIKTALALQWACELEQENCVTEANNLFAKYVEGEAVNPNLRSTVYCSAIRQEESRENWDHLWEKFGQTKLATEQVIILTALGCSKDETVLNEYLKLSIDSTSGIRKQDANSVFSAVLAGNPGNVHIAFQFLQDNVEDIVNYYDGMNALSSIVSGIADRLTTEEQIDAFEAFIQEHNDILKDAAVTGETAVETARANLQWVEANEQELNDWLYEVYGSAASVTLSLTVLLVTLGIAFVNN